MSTSPTVSSPAIKALPLEERLDLAARLLERRTGEVGHAGIFVLRVSEKELEPKHLRALERMADDFIGWSHVDDFCDAVLQSLLVRHPGPVLRMLERWTRSRNCWKRRSSVVVFTRKVGESGAYADHVLAFSERLAFDDDDLVRKGVGWALKDSMRADKNRVLAFVKELRRRGAPSVVTLYAIRALKGAEREAVLAVKPERVSPAPAQPLRPSAPRRKRR
jgi:3-methyladenine DNA glycosylase AlkD